MTLIDIAAEFLNAIKGDLDKYTTRKGSIERTGQNAVTLLTPAHIQFAKYGRGPGKQPPHKAILDWVKREGVIFPDSTAEGTAWAIAKSIAKNGTKNYVPNAPNAMEESISKYYSDYLGQLSSIFTIAVNDEVKEIEMLPKEIEQYKI